jgi:hypothetical protein
MVVGRESGSGHGPNPELSVGAEPEIRLDIRLIFDLAFESLFYVVAHICFGEMGAMRFQDRDGSKTVTIFAIDNAPTASPNSRVCRQRPVNGRLKILRAANGKQVQGQSLRPEFFFGS